MDHPLALALLSDDWLFPVLQVSLALFALFAMLKDRLRRRRIGRGEVIGVVHRGDKSMGKFYAAYGAATAILVGIALSTDAAQGFRVLFVLGDSLLVAYVCILNRWFRDILLSWVGGLGREIHG